MKLEAGKGTIYARWISIFFGIVSFALVFVVERLGSVLQVSDEFHYIALIELNFVLSFDECNVLNYLIHTVLSYNDFFLYIFHFILCSKTDQNLLLHLTV